MIIKKHSFDVKRRNRYRILKGKSDNCIIRIRGLEDMGSYFNAIKKRALYDYDGSNCVFFMIDTYTAESLKQIISIKGGC